MEITPQEFHLIAFIRTLANGEKLEIGLDRKDPKKLWWRRTKVDEGGIDFFNKKE